MKEMETKNFYQSNEPKIQELEKRLQLVFTEILYLKMANKTMSEKDILNSTGILCMRFGEFTNQMELILKLLTVIIRETKQTDDKMQILRQQLNNTNKQILLLSNSLTTASYFIKNSIYNDYERRD